MSPDAKRNWQEKFTPPAPPVLPTPEAAPAPSVDSARLHLAAPEDSDARREVSPAQARVLTPVRPGAAPAVPAEDAAADRPSTRTERAHASALVAELAAAGIDAQLVGVRRGTSTTAFDVELAASSQVGEVVLLADALAQSLDVAQVRISRRDDPRIVRLEVAQEGSETGRGRQKAVWVPVEVRDAASQEKDRVGETFTEYFLGAFNRQYAHLDSFFARRPAAPGPMPQKRSRRRRGIETSVQLWLYLSDEQLEILDEAVDRSGAGSRSALVTRILAADLGLPADAVRGS